MSTAIPAAVQILTRRRDALAAQVADLKTRLDELDGLIRVLGEAEPAAPAVYVPPPAWVPIPEVTAAPACVSPPPPAGTVVVYGEADRPKPEAAGRRDFPRELAAAIRDRGPLTPTQAAEAIGVHVATAGKHLRDNPALFEKADPGNYKSPYTLTPKAKDWLTGSTTANGSG